MDLVLLAQVATWGIAQWAMALVILIGVVAIAIVAIRAMGVTIPPFIVTILWILLAVIIGVAAIKFLITML